MSLLLADDHTVRVLSRSAKRARARFGDKVDVHEGDVRTPDSLVGAARNVEFVISAFGTRTFFGRNGGPAVDATGTQNLVEAVGRESIGQFVLLSAFGLDRSSMLFSAVSLLFNRYYACKEAAEQAVRSSQIPYTCVRPVGLLNRPARGQATLNQSEPLALLRTMSRDLVAEVLVACLGCADATNKTFELYESSSDEQGVSIERQLAKMHLDSERPVPPRTPLW